MLEGIHFKSNCEIVCNLIEIKGFLIEETSYKIFYICIRETEKLISSDPYRELTHENGNARISGTQTRPEPVQILFPFLEKSIIRPLYIGSVKTDIGLFESLNRLQRS